ncbi:hypothetical protein PENTCL1PPCAC_7520, partial [Pristionchus entomophagus]
SNLHSSQSMYRISRHCSNPTMNLLLFQLQRMSEEVMHLRKPSPRTLEKGVKHSVQFLSSAPLMQSKRPSQRCERVSDHRGKRSAMPSRSSSRFQCSSIDKDRTLL